VIDRAILPASPPSRQWSRYGSVRSGYKNDMTTSRQRERGRSPSRHERREFPEVFSRTSIARDAPLLLAQRNSPVCFSYDSLHDELCSFMLFSLRLCFRLVASNHSWLLPSCRAPEAQDAFGEILAFSYDSFCSNKVRFHPDWLGMVIGTLRSSCRNHRNDRRQFF